MNRTMDSKITPEGAAGGRREKNQNIQVFVRVRPMSNQEIAKHTTEVIDTPGTREVVVKERAVSTVTKTFTFDKVFGPRSKQPDVYKTVVAPLLAEVLLGYNCTVFAYGQTGTGKTFTMEGDRSQSKYNTDQSVCVENDPSAGILPRALSHLFDEVRLMECEWTVRVSFLELYNEELFDLLAPIDDLKHRTLRLFDDGHRKGSVVIQGLEEVIVTNKHEVYGILERGSQQRKTAATLLNASSSRSHTIFTITVHLRENSVDSEEMIKIGKLHLVDLAGSENIGKSGAVDKRAREAGSINQSLLTLGRVISALVERTPHVPYRESKLTRLLQDSLGGRTKTSIIATISPAALNIEETLSTLEYAHRAKNIMNRPEVNQRLTKKEALNIYSEEIDRLRRDLNATREKNGMFMDMDNYNRIMAQIESQRHELNEKSSKIRELEENIVEKEEEHRQAMDMMDELKMDLQAKQAIIEDIKMRKQRTEEELAKSKRRNDELNYLVDSHVTTEEKLSNEANVLLSTATDTVSIIEALHTRLDRKQQVEERNWKNGERFREEFHKYVDDLIKEVNKIRENHTINASNIRHDMKNRSQNWKSEAQAFQKKVSRSSQSVAEISQALLQICEQNESITNDQKIATDEATTKECGMVRERNYKDLTTVINEINEIARALIKTKTEMENLSREISTRVSNMADEGMGIIDKANELQKEIIENIEDHVNVQCDEVSSGSATLTSKLQHVAGNVDEFWEETYLSDSPSGATPSRRKYDFPTKLSATSPHDRIITRYRRLRSDVQVTIDEAAEGSDSDIPTPD